MNQPHPTVLFVIGLLFLLAVAAPPLGAVAEAAAIVVDTLSDELNGNGNCSLREAITAANTNAPVDACPAGSGAAVDTITFGVSGTIVLGSVLPSITDASGLTVDGAGAVTISGNGAVGVLVVNQCATLNLANITVANAARAHAIVNNGMLNLSSTTLANNVYTGSCCGGGISTTGPLTVTDSTFSGNSPDAIYTEANLARGDFTTAPVNIANSTFTGNNRSVQILGSTVSIVNSTFANNADAFWGGSAIWNDRGTVTIARSTFTGNRGGRSGAIATSLGSVTVRDSSFANNLAYRENTYAVGGAIDSSGTTLVIAHTTFVDNEALFVGLSGFSALGGAIAINGGAVTIASSTFSGNFARVFNYFGTSRAFGGAIYAAGSSGAVNIVNSTFAGNHTLRYTGSSSPTPDALSGNAIRNDGTITITLRNTLVANTAIVPWNSVSNCSGPLADGGGNLSTDASCPGVVGDPLLDPAGVQDNGGPTGTIALQPGSPAIGAGVAATCAAAPVNGLDQRDAPRVSCDSGAFAYASTPPAVTPPDPPPPLPYQSGCVAPDRAPVVTNPGNQTSVEGAVVSLQITATDPDGDALTYSATGLPSGLGIDAATGLVTGTLGFATAGAYGVTVTVTDARGASASVSFTWTVTDVNQPPTVTSPGNPTSAEGTSPSLAIIATDPDGDALTYSASGLPPGLSIDATTGTITGSLGYHAAGTYTVTATASDGQGGTASTSFTWTVTDVNRAPAVTTPANQTSAEGTSPTIAISASDPDGDTLTYSATGLPPGVAINATTGVITGALSFTSADTYNPTVTVDDGKGGTASTTFTWTVTDVNRAPVLAATGDRAVTAGSLLSFALSASDPDGDPLTFSATGLPDGASLDPATGAFSWTPALSQVGQYTVTFRATDARGLAASRTSAITVTQLAAQNRAPICSDARPSVAEIWPPNHRLVPISILGVTDPDGDPVTITITRILQDEPTNTRGDGATVIDGFGVGTSQASVRAERSGTPRVPGNGRVYEIEFTASDGNGGSCAGSVRVGVPHDQGHGPAIDEGVRYDSTVPAAAPGRSVDLRLSFHAPRHVSVGRTLTYLLQIRNNGPDAASGVVATLSMPAGVRLVTSVSNRGRCTGAGLLSCSLGTLRVSSAASIRVVVTPVATGRLATTATVSSGHPTAVASHAMASAETTVR